MAHFFFPPDGVFYKTNLHCHTTISDGTLTPVEVRDAYRAAGYAAVAFTDHEAFLPHTDLCTEDFIALHGFETAVKEHPRAHTGAFQKVYHLNLLAKDQNNVTQPFIYPDNMTPGNCRKYLDCIPYTEELVYEYSAEGVNDLIRRARAAGFFCTLNHPAWSLLPSGKYLHLRGLHGVEVMNGSSFANGDCSGLPLGEFLREGERVLPIGGDDNHNFPDEEDSFLAFTMLCAREFSYAGLMEAYEKGWLYASTGPRIEEMQLDGDTLTVRTSPASRVVLLSEGRYTQTVRGDGMSVATLRLPWEKMGAYFRLEIADAAGGLAITRGYFRDEWQEE